jgi:hypothetical protein
MPDSVIENFSIQEYTPPFNSDYTKILLKCIPDGRWVLPQNNIRFDSWDDRPSQEAANELLTPWIQWGLSALRGYTNFRLAISNERFNFRGVDDYKYFHSHIPQQTPDALWNMIRAFYILIDEPTRDQIIETLKHEDIDVLYYILKEESIPSEDERISRLIVSMF